MQTPDTHSGYHVLPDRNESMLILTVASESVIKREAVESYFGSLPITRLFSGVSKPLVEQPIGVTGITTAAESRLMSIVKLEPREERLINAFLSIENGLVESDGRWSDVVAVVLVWNGLRFDNLDRLDQTEIRLPKRYLPLLDRCRSGEVSEYGWPKTFGSEVARAVDGCSATNWMGTLCGVDRRTQIRAGLATVWEKFVDRYFWAHTAVDREFKPGYPYINLMRTVEDPLLREIFFHRLDREWETVEITAISGPECRGFALGMAYASVAKLRFIPIRKKGKLSGRLLSETFPMAYADDVTLELEVDDRWRDLRGQKVLILDDVVSTGESMKASIKLLEAAGAEIAGWGAIADVKVNREQAAELLKGARGVVMMRPEVE